MRTEQDATTFIIAHHSAIGPQNPAGDRLKNRAPPEPASATTAYLLATPRRLRAFGLDLQPQVELDLKPVTPFPSHSELRPNRRTKPPTIFSTQWGFKREPWEHPPTYSPVQVNHDRTLTVSRGRDCDRPACLSVHPNLFATSGGRHLPRAACRSTDDCGHQHREYPNHTPLRASCGGAGLLASRASRACGGLGGPRAFPRCRSFSGDDRAIPS